MLPFRQKYLPPSSLHWKNERDSHFAGREEREQFGFRFRVHFRFGLVQFGNSRRSVVIQNLALS